MVLFAILQRLLAAASLVIWAGAVWLIWRWWEAERFAELAGLPEPSHAGLWFGLALVAFGLMGRLPLLMLLGRGGGSPAPRPGERGEVAAPDGAVLGIETEGAAEGPILVFTHGWGLNSRIWAEARRDLGARYDLVFWDLPGCGRSSRPLAGWSIESFAEDLHALVDALPAERPVVLVGHSIGGMVVQTLCARRPELLNCRIAAIALFNTTHENPLRTMLFSGLFTKLQPVIEAACRLDIALSPVVWLMNWQAYLSGSTHLAARIAGFGTRPTREQLDRTARLPTATSPAVQAHGNLAMFRWSITDRLASIEVPALVFVGGRDVITKDHAGERIAAALPQGRLVRSEAAGHMGPVEASRFYHEQLIDFVGFVDMLRSRRSADTGRSFLRPDEERPPAASDEDDRSRQIPGQSVVRP